MALPPAMDFRTQLSPMRLRERIEPRPNPALSVFKMNAR